MRLPLLNTFRLLLTVLTEGIITVAGFNHQLLHAQTVTTGSKNYSVTNSFQLPAAREKIIAAVYPFRGLADSSLQKENSVLVEGAPNYTNILFDVLEQSGWFVPTNYQKVGNLLNQSVNSQPELVQRSNGKPISSAPDPTVLLEAGVLSYEGNSVTDEIARHYFSEGSFTRQDQVTLYLRALSANSGKILKTIYSSKTLLSQPTNIGTFRYVLLRQALVAETSVTSTSPSQLVVTIAIEKAVQGLIIEGIRDGLWSTDNLSPLDVRDMVGRYEQQEVKLNELYRPIINSPQRLINLRRKINASVVSIYPYVGVMRYTGDYTQREIKPTYGLSAEMYITPIVGVQINATAGAIASQDAFSVNLSSLEVNAVIRPLPFQRWTPILYGGLGTVSRSYSNPFQLYGTKYGQVQAGVGVQFSPNSIIGLRSMLSYTQPFTDSLDGLIMGAHKDYIARVVLGLIIHLGTFPEKISPIKFIQVPSQRD